MSGIINIAGSKSGIVGNITASAAELNIMDGVTSTAAELNLLDGLTDESVRAGQLVGISYVSVPTTDPLSSASGNYVTLDSGRNFIGVMFQSARGEDPTEVFPEIWGFARAADGTVTIDTGSNATASIRNYDAASQILAGSTWIRAYCPSVHSALTLWLHLMVFDAGSVDTS